MVKRGRMPVFKERLVELQGEKSVKDFADEIGITRQAMGYYLNGDRIPDIQMLHQICSACNVSSDWLLGLSDVRSTDIELKAICEYTGLTEESIEKLRKCKDIGVPEFLDNFLCISQDIIDFLFNTLKIAAELRNFDSAQPTNDSDTNMFSVINGRLSLPLNTSSTYMQVLTIRAFATQFEKIIDKTIEELSDKSKK